MRKKNKSLKNVACFLGQDTQFEGSLKFFGTARIDGRVKGKILSAGTTIIIGETAKIESDVYAATVISYGEIHGKITAEKEIVLRFPAKVYGNIEAPSVEIEKGVIFEGTSWQRKPEQIDDEKTAIELSLKNL